jgi:hypothetical protein
VVQVVAQGVLPFPSNRAALAHQVKVVLAVAMQLYQIRIRVQEAEERAL